MEHGLDKFKELLQQDDLLEQVVQQLNKDLNPTVDFSWNNASEDPYADFVQQVTSFIKTLMRGDHQTFMQRIYVVDVPEHKLNRAIADTQNADHAVAFLVLDRVTQKVLTRKMFKNK